MCRPAAVPSQSWQSVAEINRSARAARKASPKRTPTPDTIEVLEVTSSSFGRASVDWEGVAANYPRRH